MKIGINDIIDSFRKINIPITLAKQDIKIRYKRSILGPFWITISVGIMVLMMGVIFSSVFNVKLKEFLPYIALGLIFWGLFNETIINSSSAFIEAEPIIKDLPLPFFLYIIRTITRSLFVFAHNLIIIPLLIIYLDFEFSYINLLFIPGFLLVLLNLSWLSLLIAIFCTRYRDFISLIQNILQVLFYATPIIWQEEMIKNKTGEFLLYLNPFYYCLDLIRSPILGIAPMNLSWYINIIIFIIGLPITIFVLSKTKRNIVYWI